MYERVVNRAFWVFDDEDKSELRLSSLIQEKSILTKPLNILINYNLIIIYKDIKKIRLNSF